MPIIPALKRLRLEDYKFKARLGCTTVNSRPVWAT
jgi:hypothetical protein